MKPHLLGNSCHPPSHVDPSLGCSAINVNTPARPCWNIHRHTHTRRNPPNGTRPHASDKIPSPVFSLYLLLSFLPGKDACVPFVRINAPPTHRDHAGGVVPKWQTHTHTHTHTQNRGVQQRSTAEECSRGVHRVSCVDIGVCVWSACVCASAAVLRRSTTEENYTGGVQHDAGAQQTTADHSRAQQSTAEDSRGQQRSRAERQASLL
jgi:hypothetical protein